jgi:3-phytase
MQFINKLFSLLILFLLVIGCSTDSNEIYRDVAVVTVEEEYLTPRDEQDNVDSPAIWHGAGGEHWLLATAKETDVILAYDATNGRLIKRFAGSGVDPGQLDRPNGIAVIDSFVFIVERDNNRIQVFSLPSFRSVGIAGQTELLRPYGLTVFKTDTLTYQVYVTDNYEDPGEQVPASEELDERIIHFAFEYEDGRMYGDVEKTFGATSGDGMLNVVESIAADTLFNRLLIADEFEQEKNIKIYNLQGKFTGQVLGDSLFRYEPEGIALYSTGDSTGYWFTTDQDEKDNRFYIFDRRSLDYLGSYTGKTTSNTDGIALSSRAFGDFEGGAFFAVHDDGNVAAIQLKTVLDSLNLQ